MPQNSSYPGSLLPHSLLVVAFLATSGLCTLPFCNCLSPNGLGHYFISYYRLRWSVGWRNSGGWTRTSGLQVMSLASFQLLHSALCFYFKQKNLLIKFLPGRFATLPGFTFFLWYPHQPFTYTAVTLETVASVSRTPRTWTWNRLYFVQPIYHLIVKSGISGNFNFPEIFVSNKKPNTTATYKQLFICHTHNRCHPVKESKRRMSRW